MSVKTEREARGKDSTSFPSFLWGGSRFFSSRFYYLFFLGGGGRPSENFPERKTRCKGGHQKVSFSTVHNGSLYCFVYFWSLVFMKTCFTQSMVQVHTRYHHSYSAFLHFHLFSPTMTVSSPSLSELLSEMDLLACKRCWPVTVTNTCPLTSCT